MRPLQNQTHKTQTTSSRITIRTAAKLLAICLLVAAVPIALYVRVKSEDSAKFKRADNSIALTKQPKEHVTVHAAGRGKPFLNLQDGREMGVTYRGNQAAVAALQSGAQARALTSADFDGNGTPDVVAGYGFNGTGIITLQRGNPDAFAPSDDSVFVRMQQGYNPDSLLPDADVYSVPVTPDFLVTGNFTKGSLKDVIFAAKGGGLYLMKGKGAGRFGDPEQINLPGPVTALAAGEFRAADGITDLAVGVSGPDGQSLLIFDNAQDGFSNALVQYPLAAPASAIEFGGLDDDPFNDVAVAAGNEVDVVHGWGRKEEVTPASRVERMTVGSDIRGLALGQFTWNRDARTGIAALTSDGTIHIVENAKNDTRPFSEAEKALRTRGNLKPQKMTKDVDVESGASWKSAQSAGWKNTKQILGNNLSADLPKPLMRTNLGYREMDEITLVGQAQSKLEILRPLGPNDAALTSDQSLSVTENTAKVTLDVQSTPVAVLPLPRKLNGVTDVVMLDSTSSQLNIVPNAPNTTITVDRTDDPSGAGLTAASACTAALNDCSLRGALQFANFAANNNTTINLPAGTYILSINGTTANGCTDNTNGDVSANQTMTITGAGAATTIIRQTGTGPANDGDRIMCMEENFSINQVFNFSGITFTGGRDGAAAGGPQVFGGGGIIGGELNDSLTLTNVVMVNNWTVGPGLGGAAIEITGGNLTIINSTFGGSSAPGLYTDRASVTNANQSGTSGGGVSFTPSSPMHMGGTGILTVTGSTFSRNTSSGAGGAGADLYIIAFAAPGGIGSGNASIGTTAFSNNQALSTGSGGAILVESLPTTVATTSFTNNSANNRGGAIYVAGSSLLLNGTTPSITMTGNTAPSGGSSVSTVSMVNVDGTNTILGGDIQIGTGGTWTNNAGSTLSPTNVVITGGTFNMNNSTMNVSGNLTIESAPLFLGTFNGGTGTVNLQGNFIYHVAGPSATVFNAGTGTFNFNGSGSQSISNDASITFFNLTDSNTTQPLTANNSFNVNGSLNVNGANAIFNPVAGAVIGGTGTLTGTGTARVTRTAATADFLSQYTITNKTLTNLTVEYIGSAAQVLSAFTFGPLKINNGSGVNLAAGTATVNGLLTLQTGALNVGTSTLVLNDGSSVVGGSITSNPTGTVNYNQSSDGQNVRAFNYGNLTFSNFNKVLEPTGTIGIAGVFTPGTATGHTITGSTINFNGTGAQTVPAFNYNNLTISGARGTNNVTLANSGTIGVAGIFNPTATFTNPGTYVITNSTVNFNGSGAQTIPAFNYFNLTSSNSGARTLQNSGIIGIASVFTPGTNVYTVTGSTVSYNGTSPQTLPSGFTTYFNLTSNNTAGVGGFSGLTVQSTLRMQAGTFTANNTTGNIVQIDSGATLAGTNGTTINVGGNWTNNGTFTANTNTVNFNGSTPQTIGGSSTTTFNNLTIANAVSPVSLGQNANVNAVLTLTNDLTTGANILTMPNTGTSAGGADVVGNVRRTGFVGGGPALSFGNPFNSIGFIAQGTVPTDILVNLVKAAPGGFPGSAINRTYTITPTGGTGFSSTLRLHYLDAELNGNTEATLGLFRNTPPWVRLGRTGAVDTVNNWAELSGVTAFSAWTLSSAKNGTTTTITADTPDPSQVAESVTINFTVVSNVAGAPPVTGNVTITVNDASGDTCTGTVTAGAGTCNIPFTLFGSKTLTATYNGDDNFSTSTDTEPHVVDEPDVTVAVSPASVLEDGPTNLVYTFTREGPTTSALTVNFSAAGTASSSTDYALTGAATFDGTNGTLTIPIGSSTAALTVNPNTDSTVEPDETVIVNVTAGTGYDVGVPGSATGTITNDDTDVSVAVAPSSTTEDGAGNLVFTFTRAGVTTGALTANFTVGGTATFNTDYTQTGAATFAPPNGTVQFAAGSSTATVTVDPTADTTVEPDETVILTVAAGTGYNVGAPSTATGTITNDDTDVSIAVAPASVNEDGATNLVYTFTRVGVTSTPLTVNFTIGGTATFNTDYTQTGAATFVPPNGTVTFGAGNSTAMITVDPTADITSEPDETVILTLAAGTGYNVIAPSTATGTIVDDDVTVSVAVSPGSVAEDGATNLVYTFTRNDSDGALTANFSIGGTATFNTDYTQTGAATFAPPNGTVTFANGSLTATVTIDPVADSTVEPDETVILTVVAGTGYNPAAPTSATGTITNDDTDVSVAVAPSSTAEDGAGNLVYTFTRTGVTTGALTANFTINGTATFNTDYTQTGAATFAPPNGTVQFAAGSSTATVTVDPTPDTTVEPDETVILTVAPGTGYNVAAMNNSATGTITNDDTDVSLAVAPSAVNEDGAANLVYTFTRVGVTSTPLTVNFTIGGTATFSVDYTQTGAATFVPPNGTVTFSAGNSTATITVDPTADMTSEPDETVILTLAAGTGYNVVAPSTATGTITNDDVQVSVAVSPGSVAEDGATNLVYTFTRNDSNGALTANFSIGGTATFNTDYTQLGAASFVPPNGTVTFANGSLTTTVTIDPAADSTVEPDETVVLTVVAGSGYTVGAPSSATGTITNDDTDVSVAVAPSSTAEDGAGNVVYTFTRTGVTTGALTANFTINGTATFNTDYTQTGAATFAPPNGTVQFAAGSSTATVTVDPTPDTAVEPDETVILTVAPGTGYNVAAVNNSATGTITNDDTDVSVAVAPASVAEDGPTNLVYTFTRNGVTTGALTVNFTIGGTATFSVDYTQIGAATFVPPNGTVIFGAGNSTATVTVNPTADMTSEPDETVILTVAAGTGYNVGAPSAATGTILNDDAVDVEITAKTDTPDPVCVGANITYTIGFRNNSSGAAPNAKVTDTVPANTTFVSATLPAGWSRADSVVAGGTGTLMFTNPSVAGGGTASFTVVVKINAGVLGGTIISNTATASSDSPDDVPGNNSKTATTTVDPTPPTVSNPTADPASLWPKNHKLRDVTINYTATDSCGGVNCQITSVTSNQPVDGTGDGDTSPDWVIVDEHHVQLRAESAGGSEGRIYTITVTCTDAAGNSTTKTVDVHVGHNILTPTSGTAFKVNTAVTFTGTFWDVPGKKHTAVWQFDDLTTGATVTEPAGSKNGTVKGNYTFKDSGVYKVTLKVTDNTGVTSWVDTQDDIESIVVVYDPASGYTIGGGWIYSPLGALVSDPSMIGKMTFGFNSKFFKGATNPKGESQLDFLIGNFEFNALNYDYLVIDKARAQFSGFGKLNGVAGYDFIVTVIDGGLPGGDGVDKFRIKIWDKTTGVIVYDNQPGASDASDPITPIGLGGDISIKK